MSNQKTDSNRYFKMGAVVAIGELFDMGRLGLDAQAAGETKDFLASFGIRSLADVLDLGITGPYLHDFERLFAA